MVLPVAMAVLLRVCSESFRRCAFFFAVPDA